VSELLDGDIVLVHARWWLRWLCAYDHAAIVWRRPIIPDEWDCYTVEAGMTGVRSWRMGNWGRGYTVVRPFTPSNERGRSLGYQAANAALRMQGTVYGWMRFARVIIRMVRRRLARFLPKKMVAAQVGVVCSELVALSWQLVGVELCPGVRTPSPDDLFDAVSGRRAEVVGEYAA